LVQLIGGFVGCELRKNPFHSDMPDALVVSPWCAMFVLSPLFTKGLMGCMEAVTSQTKNAMKRQPQA